MKYGGLVGNVIMGVYLISLSYSDMKRRKLSVGVIVLGFLSALVFRQLLVSNHGELLQEEF